MAVRLAPRKAFVFNEDSCNSIRVKIASSGRHMDSHELLRRRDMQKRHLHEPSRKAVLPRSKDAKATFP